MWDEVFKRTHWRLVVQFLYCISWCDEHLKLHDFRFIDSASPIMVDFNRLALWLCATLVFVSLNSASSLSYTNSFIIQPDGQTATIEIPYRFQVETRDELNQTYGEYINWDFSVLLSSPTVLNVSADRISVSRTLEPWLWDFIVRFEKIGDGNNAPYYAINPAINGTSICQAAAVIVLPGTQLRPLLYCDKSSTYRYFYFSPIATPGVATAAIGQGLISGIAGQPNQVATSQRASQFYGSDSCRTVSDSGC